MWLVERSVDNGEWEEYAVYETEEYAHDCIKRLRSQVDDSMHYIVFQVIKLQGVDE